MEKCKICGKETPMMQLGVRYCTKCGDSVIPVCQPCGVHPFYCKSCKARGGWQEDKDPDCIGKDGKPKARRHRDAKLKAEACKANNNSMLRTNECYNSKKNELYHVTFKSKSSNLKKEGIFPKRTHTYRGRFGRKLKDLGTIYAFTNFDDAVRWASKMQFDFKKPTKIVVFRGNASEWEQDTHWESAGAKGKWLKKKGAVLPEDIIEIVPLTQEMTRAVVQTGFKDKELTRLHGVVETE